MWNMRNFDLALLIICGPLVLDVMRNRIALGIIPGETYREPQAPSFKQQAVLDSWSGIV